MNIAQSLTLMSLLSMSLPAFAQARSTAHFRGTAPDSLTIVCDGAKLSGDLGRARLPLRVDTFSSNYGEPKQLLAAVDQACKAGEAKILLHVSPTGRVVRWVAIR